MKSLFHFTVKGELAKNEPSEEKYVLPREKSRKDIHRRLITANLSFCSMWVKKMKATRQLN